MPQLPIRLQVPSGFAEKAVYVLLRLEATHAPDLQPSLYTQVII